MSADFGEFPALSTAKSPKSAGLRWHLADEERDGQSALFGVDGLTGPERGTGKMSGLEFLHVTAKKILNPVPAASRMNFRWTINVYRGCSHGCTYCLVGETPILMADGRVKPLAAVQVGDLVYGTERRGRDRRFVPSSVLAHWSTTKPGYRVTLLDGTEIIASGDHRFLTGRGWKHVADNAHGLRQRAHLTTGDSLLGVGQLPEPPKLDDEYRRGYLCAMIRGDAYRATHPYDRTDCSHGTVHRFRLASADAEPLARSRDFLEQAGIATTLFCSAPAGDNRRETMAIRTSAASSITAIHDLIAWPSAPTSQWRLGYLAGIFDAEGSCSDGVLRVSNSDPQILGVIASSLDDFGFGYRVEPPRANGLRAVRLLGGLRERLRFVISTDVVTTRKRVIDDVAVTSDAPLDVASIEPLGLDLPMFDITTSTGDFVANGVVSHNCFARPTHEYLGLNLGEDFDRKIVVKINAVERVRAELADPKWAGESVAMGTNTDPYQRCEGKYKLTRGVVEALTERGNPFSILTKSALVLRDLDLLVEAAAKTDVTVNFSIGTLDERVWRATEPGTPNPRRRVEAMRRLAEAGIRTGALIAPILPGISDRREQLREVVDAVQASGGRILGTLPLHLRPGTREHYLAWLQGVDPELHARYLRAYQGRAYLKPEYGEWLRRTFDELTGKTGSSRPRLD